MTLYIIGNGFDLHHNLKTKYSDFKKFVKKYDSNLVDIIDDMLKNNCHSTNEIENWEELENYTLEFSILDYDEIYYQSFKYIETDIDEAYYWDEPIVNMQLIVDQIININNKLQSFFKPWIDSIEISKESINKDVKLSKKNFYITFNFTKTLEMIYGIPKSNVWHIHENQENYIFGHNGIYEKPFNNPNITYLEESFGRMHVVDDTDIRSINVKEQLNSVYDEIFYCYYKNSKSIIKKNNTEFVGISSSIRKIIFMGFSFGRQDELYLDFFANLCVNCKKIIVYYHQQSDYNRGIHLIRKCWPNLKSKYIKW